jgi:hypothetical protein
MLLGLKIFNLIQYPENMHAREMKVDFRRQNVNFFVFEISLPDLLDIARGMSHRGTKFRTFV